MATGDVQHAWPRRRVSGGSVLSGTAVHIAFANVSSVGGPGRGGDSNETSGNMPSMRRSTRDVVVARVAFAECPLKKAPMMSMCR